MKNERDLNVKVFLENDFLKIQLSNNSIESIKIWELWNSWGWKTFSFNLRKETSGEIFKIFRDINRDWTVNYPSVIEIKPKASQEFTFSLNDGTWISDMGIKSFKNQRIQIQAVFRIDVSSEAKEFSVFIGEIKSDWINSSPNHKWLYLGQ